MQSYGFLRAASAALLMACQPWILSGCVLHHRTTVAACKQPQFSGDNRTLQPLRVPPGLDAPDTAEGVRIPALNQPAPVRAQGAPCLDWPPAYVTEPPVPPARRPS